MKNKRIISVILVLIMVFSIPQLNFMSIALTTVTEPDTSFGLDFTSCTSEWIGSGSYAGVDWNGSNQLTLTNATIHGKDSPGENFAIKVPSGTIIILVGRNTLIAGSCTDDGFSRGIYSKGDLTIKGNGSLLVSGGSASSSRDTSGIVVYGFLTIDENPSIITKGGAAGATGVGIYAMYDVTINGGTITAIDGLASASGQSNGIYSSGQIYLNGGTVTASSNIYATKSNSLNKAPICTGVTALTGDSSTKYAVYGDAGTYNYSSGLDFTSISPSTGNLDKDGYHWEQSTSTLTIENLIINSTALNAVNLPDGSTLDAEGLNIIKSSNAESSNTQAIYCPGDLSIQGSGVLTVIGGNTGDRSCGIFAENNINIASGTINAIGETAQRSYGILTYNDVTISGGDVTAISGTAGNSSMGINASSSDVTISGGNVTAVGGTTTSTDNSVSSGISGLFGPKISGGNVIAIAGIAGSTNDHASCGIFANAYGGTVLSGGNITVIGNISAIFRSMSVLNNVVSIASTNVDGSNPVTYNYTNIGTYKYLQITPPPSYAVTITVNKDSSVWTDGTPTMQLSTSNSSLQDAISGTCSSGVYTFTELNPSQTYYAWDTTNNQYTGKCVSSSNTSAAVDYYTVSLTAGTGIDSVSGGGVYLKGSSVSINATVSSGYAWSKWTQTAGGADVTINKNYSIANITAPQSYTANATISSATGPTILSTTGGLDTYGYAENSIIINVGAIPASDTDYTLSYQWYDNGTTNSISGGSLISGATSASYSIPKGKSAGIYYYYCVVTATREDNGQKASATTPSAVKVTIEKTIPTVTLSANPASHTTYGNDVVLTATISGGSSATGTVTFKVNGTQTGTSVTVTGGSASLTVTAPSVNSYSYSATYSGDSNNETVNSNTLNYSVNKAEQGTLSITGVPTTKTYGDAAFTVTATGGNSTGNYVWSVSDSSKASISASGSNNNIGTVTIKAAGTFTISVYCLGDANYNNSAAVTTSTITVNKKELTISGVSVSNKTYNGTVNATITGIPSLSGVVAGDIGNVVLNTANANATFSDKKVGPGKTVTFSGYTISGTAAANYTLSQPASVTANITAKDLHINAAINNKPYDGLNTATYVTPPVLNIADIASGDIVSITGTIPTPTFASVNIGNNITVNLSGDFAITGTDAENYNLIQPALTANITTGFTPVNGTHYTLSTVDGTNGWYKSSDFIITAAAGFKVSLTNTNDGTWMNSFSYMEDVSDGSVTFYVKNTSTNEISVAKTEDYKLDKTAPTGTIVLGTNSWNSFLNTITFGLFFKDTQSVTISADDAVSGVANVQYLLSDNAIDSANIASQSGWKSGASFNITPDCKKIIYTKITDNAGNISYISSDGMIFDATAPGISTSVSGDFNLGYKTIIVTITENSSGIITTQWLEGNCTISDFASGGTVFSDSFNVTSPGTYTVYAKDKAGNESIETVSIQKDNQSTLSICDINAKTYGDASFDLFTSGGSGTGGVSYEVTSGNAVKITGNIITIVGTGSVEITAMKAADSQYNAATATSEFEVNPATLTATFMGDTINYGDTPDLTVNVTGFVYGETSLTAAGYIAPTVTVLNTNANSYILTPAGGAATNYKFDYVSGTLTINKVNWSVTNISDISKCYDGNAVSAPIYNKLGTGEATIKYKEKGADDSTYTSIAPVNAGDYTVCITVAADGNYNEASAIKDFSISIKTIAVEDVTINNINASYLYTGNAITPVPSVKYGDFTLTEGIDYTVAYNNNTDIGTAIITISFKGNYSGSAVKNFNIYYGNADDTMFSISGGISSWASNNISITAESGYTVSATSTGPFSLSFDITAESTQTGISYTFYIKDESENIYQKTITYKIDKTAPTGTIVLGTNSWNSFINTITFGLFFKDTQTVTITANDAISGIANVQYYESDVQLSLSDLKGISGWVDGTSVNVTPVDAKKFIYYAKITDNAGNETYLSTDGATFDTTAPEITGVTNGETYYVTQKATITDDNLDTVILNETDVSSSVTLDGNKNTTYTIIATDRAGNSTTCTIIMKTIESIADTINDLTAANVKLSDKAAILNVISSANAIDLTYATDAEKTAVQAIIENCNTLLAAAEPVSILEDRATGAKIEAMGDITFDANTTLVVTPVTPEGALTSGISAVASGGNIISFFDVKLLLNGNPVDISGGKVKVTFILTNEQLANYMDFQIVYTDDNGNATIIPSEVNGNQISFETTHLSYYGIIGTKITNNESRYDNVPNTGDNSNMILYLASVLCAIFFSLFILLIFNKKNKADKR